MSVLVVAAVVVLEGGIEEIGMCLGLAFQVEAGTDLQVLLRLPQLGGGGGEPGETGGVSAGDGEYDHYQDQQQTEHRHADYHDLRH